NLAQRRCRQNASAMAREETLDLDRSAALEGDDREPREPAALGVAFHVANLRSRPGRGKSDTGVRRVGTGDTIEGDAQGPMPAVRRPDRLGGSRVSSVLLRAVSADRSRSVARRALCGAGRAGARSDASGRRGTFVSGTPRVDPRALVSPEAELADDVEVGPFTVIEAGVVV